MLRLQEEMILILELYRSTKTKKKSGVCTITQRDIDGNQFVPLSLVENIPQQ